MIPSAWPGRRFVYNLSLPARDRYVEALYYKDNDAMASLGLAQCQEKLGDKTEARKYYEQYLKILPEGEFAKEAQASLERLERPTAGNRQQ